MDGDGQTSARRATAATAFWWRLSDTAFRRWYLFVLPIVVFAALGVYQSTNTLELYRSSGALNATTNPFVPDQAAVGGAAANFWETPGDVATRTINEQLRTDSFIEEIADRAGLAGALESGELELDVVRDSVWSTADGSSLVKVNGTWADPATSLALVEGTIAGYQEYVADTVASDASEAVDFYSTQLTTYQQDVDTALRALTTYVEDEVDQVDAGDALPLLVSTQVNRLTAELDAAREKVTATLDNIETAELNVAQSKSEAGRSLRVVDAPTLPEAPESTLVSQIVTIGSFTMLGLAAAVAALLVSTVLDQSVASPQDLNSLVGVSFVATVPVIRGMVTAGGPELVAPPPRRAKRGKPAARGDAPTGHSQAGA